MEPAEMAGLHASAKHTAGLIRLPFNRRTWRGTGGNWMGAGVGSSIDFQDHRPYLPGDDPRYINWQAYARTGSYSMKLYRQEVSPQIDLVLDTSPSMVLGPEKKRRCVELFYFCLESAWRAGASVRAWLWNGGGAKPLELPELREYCWDDGRIQAEARPSADFSRLIWRTGSLRVLVSDLLFPGNADAALKPLSGAGSLAVLLSPFSREESDPDWKGNLEFDDCETRQMRRQRVDAKVLDDYRHAYQRHFDLWRASSRRHGALMAKVPAGGTLEKALRFEAIPAGVMEVVV